MATGNNRETIHETAWPLPLRHFPSRAHAFVWRNWQLAPLSRLAAVLETSEDAVRNLGARIGLGEPPTVTADQVQRSYITVIRRNWDLLPDTQLCTLLGWNQDRLDFTLREDARLWVKLGPKPNCDPLRYSPPDTATQHRERAIARTMATYFPGGPAAMASPLYRFVEELSAPLKRPARKHRGGSFRPRFCYSYFAPFGDPLLDARLDPYPDGLLERLAEVGVNGVWTQGLLYKLTPFPWDASLSEQWDRRLANLRQLTERAARFGIGVYLFFNEPRGMPLPFFLQHPQLLGVAQKGYGSLCTSLPEVQDYLRNGIERVCRAAPALTGLFTVSAEENLTHCWAWMDGRACPRCRDRSPEEVVAENARLFSEGIRAAGNGPMLIVWDWGWPDAWAPGIIERLPEDAALMCVSEWGKQIERGGVAATVNEYSLSAIGPGPVALERWALARKRGLRTIAKVQAGTTWELASVPYLPVVDNVAQHAVNLAKAGVDGLMLSWTLGAYPSINMEVFAEASKQTAPEAGEVLDRLAHKHFGAELAPVVRAAWQGFSRSYQQYPFDIGVFYTCPIHMGPANLLWEKPTGRAATMVCFPYDDLEQWRSQYPAAVLIAQFRKVAAGFTATIEDARKTLESVPPDAQGLERFEETLRMAEVCAIMCDSVANQAEFIALRDLAATGSPSDGQALLPRLKDLIAGERDLAVRLHGLQVQDARIGFEAGNHYFFVPVDLAEKVLNCEDLLERWLPEMERLFSGTG